MVTFNFEGMAAGDFGVAYLGVVTWTVTTCTIGPFSSSPCYTYVTGAKTRVESGNNPIVFSSVQAGVGLAGESMTFTVSTSSLFYNMEANPDTDSLIFGQGSYVGGGPYTLSLSDGGGLNALVDPSADLAGLGQAFWLTTGGGTAPVQDGVVFAGTVSGMRFVNQTDLELLSLSGMLACFARGTRIATPEGQTPVQDLRIGDTVLTADGGSRLVKWIGRQNFDTRMGIPERLRLVRIAAGALGGGLPLRDLVLTADHALLIGDTLVNAGALVDGGAIRWETPDHLDRRVTVYHVETGDHALILAEGAPAETFIDYLTRADFDNHAEPLETQGEGGSITELPLARVSAARLLPPGCRPRSGTFDGRYGRTKSHPFPEQGEAPW